MARTPTAGVTLANMGADGCMVVEVFDLLLLSFLHIMLQKILKSFLKCSGDVWKVKISFISKIFCYLFGTFVHDRWFNSLSINTYLVNFMISVLIW